MHDRSAIKKEMMSMRCINEIFFIFKDEKDQVENHTHRPVFEYWDRIEKWALWPPVAKHLTVPVHLVNGRYEFPKPDQAE